jgi:thioredoxin 1
VKLVCDSTPKERSELAAVAETSDSNFKTEVLEAPGVVFVDFFAPWCAPCKMLTPLVDEMAKEFSEVKFVKLNTDENPHTPQTYKLSGIPALFLFKDGKVLKSETGAKSREQLRKFIQDAIDASKQQ